MTEQLNLNFEELEQTRTRDRDFHAFIKRATSGKTAGTAKYENTKAAEYRAIISANTNDPTLYGLIDADQATKSRLVILDFNPTPSGEEWGDIKNLLGLNPNGGGMAALGAALYQYLLKDYVNPFCEELTKWQPERYNGKDKDEIIARLQHENNTPAVRFMDEMLVVDATAAPSPMRILEPRTIDNDPSAIYFVSNTRLKDALRSFEVDADETRPSWQEVKLLLKSRAHFEDYRYGKNRGLMIGREAWQTYYDNRHNPLDDEEDDGYTEPTATDPAIQPAAATTDA